MLSLCLVTIADAEDWHAERAALRAKLLPPVITERDGATVRKVVAAVPSRPWRDEATDMGLQVCDFNGGHHVQFVQDGKALANWYPSKGTTVMGNLKGPHCATGEDVIAWLKSI